MSWHYSQALVEAYSEASSSDGGLFAPLRSTDMPAAYCWPGPGLLASASLFWLVQDEEMPARSVRLAWDPNPEGEQVEGYRVYRSGWLVAEVEHPATTAMVDIVGEFGENDGMITVTGWPGARITIEGSGDMDAWTPDNEITLDAQGDASYEVEIHDASRGFWRVSGVY